MLKKLTCAVLALMMILACVSCATPGDDGGTTTSADVGNSGSGTDQSGNITDVPKPTTDAGGYLLDEIPDSVDYDQEPINVLYWADVEKPEFDNEEQTANLVENAIYKRNIALEERLKVDLKWTGVNGNYKQSSVFIQSVATAHDSGGEYDIIAAYSRTGGMLAIRGLYTNLLSIEDSQLDFNKPWWPESLIDTLTVGDSLYYISGDISTMLLHVMYGVYYNKDLVTEYNLDKPTDLVAQGKWTIDALIRLCSGKYQDLDSDSSGGNVEDIDDFYGFCTIYYGSEAFYTGSGLRIIERDETNLLKISDDYGSVKSIELADKLGDWFDTEDCNASATRENYRMPFVNGNAIFCQERCYFPDNYLKEVSFEYGVVPTPKYNEEQENYITCVGNPFTLYSIPSAVAEERRQMITTVLECWASEAYRKTTPAVFEILMKQRYSREEVDSAMFDIIRNTVSFDLGRIFGDSLNLINEIWSKCVIDNKEWKTVHDANIKLLRNKLRTIIDSYENAAG